MVQQIDATQFLTLGRGDDPKQFQQMIERCLTDRQQRVVSLFCCENKSVTQIAKELGLNKSTVSRHLHRALEILQQSTIYCGGQTLADDRDPSYFLRNRSI